MHDRKVQIEDIKSRIRRQNNKQSRIQDSYSKHKQNYEKMLEEQTKEDVKMAEDAINNLVPENIEKRSHVSPDKSLLEAF